jgi:type IV secretion system protein VirB3
MQLREIPLHRVGNRYSLVLGGDRELVMTSGVLSAVLVFCAHTLYATIIGIFLWCVSIYVLRLMAKADPLLKKVFKAHRKYKAYYPARSTPYTVNKAKQKRRYL